MKKFLLGLLLFASLFILVPKSVFATYTLPYPGIMPGNKLYPAYELIDDIKQFLAFGDFAQFSYNLSRSDKYLVEAKTLFEYTQYPLALRALGKSDHHMKLAIESLEAAFENKKNTSEKEILLKNAKNKHVEVLQTLLKKLPSEFTWEDEKKLPITLKIHSEIENAIHMRTSL